MNFIYINHVSIFYWSDNRIRTIYAVKEFFNTCMGSTLGGEDKAGMECFQKCRAQVGPALKFCAPN